MGLLHKEVELIVPLRKQEKQIIKQLKSNH